MEVSYKVKHKPTLPPTKSNHKYVQREVKVCTHGKENRRIFIAAVFKIIPNWKDWRTNVHQQGIRSQIAVYSCFSAIEYNNNASNNMGIV